MFSLILFNQGRTRKDPFVHGRLDSSTFPPDKSLSSRWLVEERRTVFYPGARLHTFWTTGAWFCLSTFLTGNAKCDHLNDKYISVVIVFSWGFYLISVLWFVGKMNFLIYTPHHPSGSLTLPDLGSNLCKPFKNRLWSCISSALTIRSLRSHAVYFWLFLFVYV